MNKEEINSAFEMACKLVKTLNKKPDNNDLLELYGYFKQATVGDCKTVQPNYLNFKEYKKWESWKSQLGTDEYTAKILYVKKVQTLLNKN